MSEEILVNVTPRETRVALVENGVLHEIYIERSSRLGLVGNIYKGLVSRVLPGLQAAFIDIGLTRTAFLHAADIVIQDDNKSENDIRKTPLISDLLVEGQMIVVQVIKDPLGTKGARLTTQLSSATRLLVFMPELKITGISQKIENEEERERLKDLVTKIGAEYNVSGFIVRTVAEGTSEIALREEIEFLHKLWATIKERIKTEPSKALIHEDLPLVLRIMRDLASHRVEKVKIDSKETYQRVFTFADQFIPDMAAILEHYPGERPIFDLYDIENEIQHALGKKVTLKSGGYLIIDQTEALTTIDVNTGAYVGHRNLEDTIFKTNLEATQSIARQVRLRNLGGIIIIDFIDMQDLEHRQQVMRTFEKYLQSDSAKNFISEETPLGLVAMTRKRTRESLERVLCESCPTCSGRGVLKTPQTVCYEIFREIIREFRQYDEVEKFLVLASQEVVDMMLDEESASFAEIEGFIKRPISLQVEKQYSQEQFDVVIM